MTRGELIQALQIRGLDRLYGRTLSSCLKRELEEAWTNMQNENAPAYMSYSRVKSYRSCPMQYYFRYVRHMVRPPGGNLVRGGACDAAFNHFYQTKLEQGTDEPESVLTDCFREDFKAREPEMQAEEKSPVLEETGLEVVKTFRREVGIKTVPLAVQERYEIKFDNTDWNFIGYADVVIQAEAEGQRMPVDNKVRASAPVAGLVEVDDQMTGYAACEGSQSDAQVIPVALDQWNAKAAGKAKLETVRSTSVRTRKDMDRWWKTVEAIHKAIRHQAFYPAPRINGSRENWVCTPKYCGFWQTCHEEF